MATIAANIQQVRMRIARACAAAQRPVQSVTLLSVSKTFGPESVREAFAAGERRFGENYVQEGVDKIAALADLRTQIEWHLIGPLQSNKTRTVAEQFDWVHSVERLKIAERLSEQRPAHLPPLQVCLAHAVAVLPRLRLRGLMAIPEPGSGGAPHRALRELLETLRAEGLTGLDTLSMGMSADLETAIGEGSTLVRVGTAIFGVR
jgi:uncharacterized pyridoxal phosphate-containing UPF0001 family protein